MILKNSNRLFFNNKLKTRVSKKMANKLYIGVGTLGTLLKSKIISKNQKLKNI